MVSAQARALLERLGVRNQMVRWIRLFVLPLPYLRCYDEKIKVHRPVLKIPMLIRLFNRYLISNIPSHVLATRLVSELCADKKIAIRLFAFRIPTFFPKPNQT